ncbi:ParM/StbA family protein [Alicyclobacillus macrosporangiidus]|uniref:Plasmid segregation protein ParM n=1 Tax=Alicyclobacillus macrosporangiidus TaxID=392015 RepID=A0A1I7LFK0_9BACL|nr:ParM/StbA family protein [Alicyclobacillus macrosporangiidus]SFV08437.1 plasmid segregation protein ParM [Alicyclobacillus macrosporangiidus]
MILGVDLGYGWVKATDGERQVRFPALVGEAHELVMPEMFGSRALEYDVTIETDSGSRRVFIGELARRESRDAALNLATRKYEDADTQALWLTTLALLAKDGEPLDVVTGLPLAHYETQRRALRQRLEETTGRVTVQGRTVDVQVRSVRVIPQAMGAMIASLLDPVTLELRNPAWTEHGGYLLLVDVGTRTTGFVTFETQPELALVNRLSDSVDVGVHDLHVALAGVFRQRTGETPPLSDRIYDELLARGEVAYGGNAVSVEPERTRHMERLGGFIVRRIVERMGAEAVRRVQTVFVAGGGYAIALPALQNAFPRVYVVPNPQMANAQGYWIYGVTRSGRG